MESPRTPKLAPQALTDSPVASPHLFESKQAAKGNPHLAKASFCPFLPID
jgi:hypothetical protein